MRTQYSRRRNSGPLALLIGTLVLIVLVFVGFRVFAPGAFYALAAPVFSSGTSLTGSVGSLFAGFESNVQLAKENVALAQEVESLKNQNLALTARTQDLTKLLGGDTSATNILAGVLARPPESPYDTLVISEGRANGITPNAEVYAQGGVPIGSIKNVTDSTAIVSLFSSPGRSTDGWAGENRLPLTLQGNGAGAFSATLPKDADVQVGDNVYVPGPGAIPLGTIYKIESDPSSPMVTIRVKPAVNLFSVTWVEVAPT